MDEIDIIAKFFSPIAKKDALKNDTYILDRFAITKDILVESIHFFPNSDPYKLAKKALRVNLSDLAATGAKPIGYLLGLALNKNTSDENWLEKFTSGLNDDHDNYNIKLLGGDTVIHDGPLMISITMIGDASDGHLTRSGAKSGDLVCVSGYIGDSYLGLLSYKGDIDDNLYFKSKYDIPDPQINLGQKLVGIASACIDISDGLLHDANHIIKTSNVGMEIYLDKIPTLPEAKNILLKNPEMINQLATAGDDYQLLFTINPELYNNLSNKVSIIGKVTNSKKLVVTNCGNIVNFDRLGHLHGL